MMGYGCGTITYSEVGRTDCYTGLAAVVTLKRYFGSRNRQSRPFIIQCMDEPIERRYAMPLRSVDIGYECGRLMVVWVVERLVR